MPTARGQPTRSRVSTCDPDRNSGATAAQGYEECPGTREKPPSDWFGNHIQRHAIKLRRCKSRCPTRLIRPKAKRDRGADPRRIRPGVVDDTELLPDILSVYVKGPSGGRGKDVPRRLTDKRLRQRGCTSRQCQCGIGECAVGGVWSKPNRKCIDRVRSQCITRSRVPQGQRLRERAVICHCAGPESIWDDISPLISVLRLQRTGCSWIKGLYSSVGRARRCPIGNITVSTSSTYRLGRRFEAEVRNCDYSPVCPTPAASTAADMIKYFFIVFIFLLFLSRVDSINVSERKMLFDSPGRWPRTGSRKRAE